MVETCTVEELSEMQNREDVTVVDVLPEDHFEEEHIQGAMNIPLEQLEDRVHELDRDSHIIVYCANEACTASPEAAELLEDHGFDVEDFEAGLEGWKEFGGATASA